MVNDFSEKLTQTFIDLFAANNYHFWDGVQAGGPDYYGIHLEKVAEDGTELDLILTFRAGKRYCCFELADHFAFYSADGWLRLRQCMDRHGLSHLPLPTIRKVRAIIEKGAVMTPSPSMAAVIWEGAEYQTGRISPELQEHAGADGHAIGRPPEDP